MPRSKSFHYPARSTILLPHLRRQPIPLFVVAFLGLTCFSAGALWGHGSMLVPESRVYYCRFSDNPENPTHPACAAAVQQAGDSQFLYDWNGIRQGDANSDHQAVVPDGELCSGGGSEFSGLDLPRSDWAATVVPNEGTFEFVYHVTAPHDTKDLLFFVTPEGWDPTQPLTWEDLDYVDEPGNPDDPVDPFCHLTSATAEPYPQDPAVENVYRMVCPMPNRTGRHVIYHVWQRIDSPEAFYACIDVELQATSTIFADGFESGGTEQWD